ncbi:Gfo/Idh/MocA family protein [Candidatus Nitrosotenuis aquarius]|uniref:Gfo/Idh/MocA family protein n=1 Tax=Candidatus Nitrosotenuis aquarius TaxID=1846278 RepID=UPI000C1EC703|nr:Gfo/Idh/MocA family oxidoreductase [Candidatus Nitrosotenuis aquarius]
MKYRCAVIGLGRIGCGFDDSPNATLISTHAGAYFRNEKTNLVAFCDVDEDKLKKYGPKYGVTKLYTDYKEMFRNESLDCVSICTHANSHLDIVKAACRFNIRGIYLEKPISESLKNAKTIIDICKKNNVKLQVNHQRRFDPFYIKLKKLVIEKQFGRIQQCSIYYGSGIANTGSHICDLIRYLFGNIKWVQAIKSQNPSNNENDPNLDGVIMCDNGIKCSLLSFDYSNYGILEFDIISTKKRIKLNLTTGKIEIFKSTLPKIGLYYKELVPQTVTFPPRTSAIFNGVETLLQSIQTNKEPLCTGEDGYLSLEAVTALIKSSSLNGKRIAIPLKNTNYKIHSK